MCESLIDLNHQLSNKLNLFKGEYISVLENIFKHIKSANNNIILGYNKDYTQYSLKRDEYTKNLAIKYKIEVMDEENDLSLISFDKMIKTDGSAYTVFGAFYKNAIKTHVKTN